jgi:hypothetical protein
MLISETRAESRSRATRRSNGCALERILVPDDHEAEARELLVDAELGNWLRP